MQPLKEYKQPSNLLTTGRLGQLALLSGKSSGKFRKGNRDKINILIEGYNTKTQQNEKLLILTKIRSLYDPWINGIRKKLSSKPYDQHLLLKLQGLEGFASIIETEEDWLSGKTTSSIVNSIPILNSNYDEFEEKNVLAEFPAQNRLGVGQFDFSEMDREENVVSVELQLVKELFGKAGLKGANKINDFALSQENAIALLSFFEANPKLLAAFSKGGLLSLREISLENDKGQGGGVFSGGGIFINQGEGIKDSFMRILVHEMGHASLQRLLGVTNDKPIETEDGKKLAEAWEILKKDEENFYGLDLGTYNKVEYSTIYANKKPRARDPQSRKKYQQVTFIEFVAESFMHMALVPDQLREHVNSIKDNPNVSEEAKQAWKIALEILERNGARLLGR